MEEQFPEGEGAHRVQLNNKRKGMEDRQRIGGTRYKKHLKIITTKLREGGTLETGSQGQGTRMKPWALKLDSLRPAPL